MSDSTSDPSRSTSRGSGTEERSTATVAFVQFEPTFGAVETNLDACERLLPADDVDLVVFPELVSTGYSFVDRAEARAVAETFPDGPTCERLAAWSHTLDAVVVGGYVEQDGDHIYNAAAVFASGKPLTSYRKVHLFGFERECFDPGGDGFPVVEHRGLRVGVMICFDWIFPEAARTLSLKGADVIAHPCNLVLPRWCQQAMVVRAIENRIYAVSANRTGSEHRKPRPELKFTGCSQIVGPSGEVIVAADAHAIQTSSGVVDLLAARHKQIPSGNDVHADRRPNQYSLD